MTVEGTTEVQELASTYNYLLDDLKHYVDELVQTQKKQKRHIIKILQRHIIIDQRINRTLLIWQYPFHQMAGISE